MQNIFILEIGHILNHNEHKIVIKENSSEWYSSYVRKKIKSCIDNKSEFAFMI